MAEDSRRLVERKRLTINSEQLAINNHNFSSIIFSILSTALPDSIENNSFSSNLDFFKEAWIKSLNRGWGIIGVDLNSG